MHQRLYIFGLVMIFLVSACSLSITATPPATFPASAPSATATPMATHSPTTAPATSLATPSIAWQPTAVASPFSSREAPLPTAVVTPALVNVGGEVCSADLAAQPPVTAPSTSTNDIDMQAAAMIGPARSALTGMISLPHYTITVTMDMRGPSLFGVETLSFVNSEQTALNELYFGLYPNAPFNGARLDVGDVTVNGRPATTSLHESDTAMLVNLPAPLPANGSLIVRMVFTTTIPTLVPTGYAPIIYSDDILTAANWYPILLVHDAAGWHTQLGPDYGDLVFSVSSLYTVNVTSPGDLIIVASGVPSHVVQNADGTKTEIFHTGPARDFYLAASHSFCVASRQVGETTVNSYYLQGHAETGQRAADVAASTMAVLGQKVGIYPFREFDVVESPTRAGGVEYPQIVAIGSHYYSTASRPRDIDFVVAHETAHQWWYSVVGNDQVMEPWLDEALTNYSVTLYWQATYGAQATESLINQAFLAPYQAAVRSGRDMPVNLPASAYGDASTYSAIVYDKGALFFVNLRRTLGDDLFFRILREYYRLYAYGISRNGDFLNLAESIGGAAVQKVYDTWILGTRQ